MSYENYLVFSINKSMESMCFHHFLNGLSWIYIFCWVLADYVKIWQFFLKLYDNLILAVMKNNMLFSKTLVT